jgi:hypothetical protein
MTVKALKTILEQFPDDMDVFLAERKTEFAFGLVNTVSIREINFKEEPDDEKVLAKAKVVVLDEE